MIIIIAKIVLIINGMIALSTFFDIFIGKNTSKRVVRFIGCLNAILICILSIYILRL